MEMQHRTMKQEEVASGSGIGHGSLDRSGGYGFLLNPMYVIR